MKYYSYWRILWKRILIEQLPDASRHSNSKVGFGACTVQKRFLVWWSAKVQVCQYPRHEITRLCSGFFSFESLSFDMSCAYPPFRLQFAINSKNHQSFGVPKKILSDANLSKNNLPQLIPANVQNYCISNLLMWNISCRIFQHIRQHFQSCGARRHFSYTWARNETNPSGGPAKFSRERPGRPKTDYLDIIKRLQNQNIIKNQVFTQSRENTNFKVAQPHLKTICYLLRFGEGGEKHQEIWLSTVYTFLGANESLQVP